SIHGAPLTPPSFPTRRSSDLVARDTGAALLKAELDVREAVRAHIPDLVGLLEGRENRSGLNSTAEWAASILAFLPEARDEAVPRSEEHTSELQSREKLVCRLL